MMRVVFVLAMCVLCAVISAAAQKKTVGGNVLSKRFTDDLEINSVYLNRSGDKAILIFEDQFWGITTNDGRTLWTKKLSDDYKVRWDLVEWVNDSVVTIPTYTTLEWINANTGQVLASVAFPGAGLDDIISKSAKRYSCDDIQTTRFGSLLFIPFEDGYQVLDLHARRLVYQASQEIEEVRFHIWGSTLLIDAKADTVTMFDMDKGTLLYKMDMTGHVFDEELYQVLIRYKDLAVIVFEEEVMLVNVAKGKQIALLELDLKEYLNYEPLILNGSLHLLLQSEQDVALLSVADAKILWKKPATEEHFGLLVRAWSYRSSDILVTTITQDNDIFVRRIIGSTGKVDWSTRLVRAEEEFDAGHFDDRPMISYSIAGRPAYNSANWKTRSYDLDSLGRQTFYSQLGIDSIGPYTDEDFMSLQSVHCVHETGWGTGGARYIGNINGKIKMVTQGRVSKAWDGSISNVEADGEAVFTIDPSNGALLNIEPTPFTRNTEGTRKHNVYRNYMPVHNAHGTSINGVQSMTFIRNDGTLDAFRFDTNEDGLFSLDFGIDHAVVFHADTNDRFMSWKVSFTSEGMKRQLITFADENNYLCLFSDTVLANVTLRYEGGYLFAYDLLTDVPKQWPNSLWTMSDPTLENLGIGTFEASSAQNDVLGIHTYEDHVLIMGSEGIAFIGAKDGCKKVLEWQGWKPDDSIGRRLRLFEPMKGGFLFDFGTSTGVIKLTGHCDASLLGYTDADADDLQVVYSRMASAIMIITPSENRLDLYQLNK